MAIEKDGECFLSKRSTSVGRVFCPLIVAVFTLIARFSVEASVLDQGRVLTSWAVHRSSLLGEVYGFLLRIGSLSVSVQQKMMLIFLDVFSLKCYPLQYLNTDAIRAV